MEQARTKQHLAAHIDLLLLGAERERTGAATWPNKSACTEVLLGAKDLASGERLKGNISEALKRWTTPVRNCKRCVCTSVG